MSASSVDRYVPAAGIAALNRWYDLGVRLLMREQQWRPLIVGQLACRKPKAVVDVGCGTGTLAVALAEAIPDARVSGVDGDRSILAQAKEKRGAENVHWVRALADELPFDDASVDAAVCTLVLHHLSRSGKRRAAAELYRILKPGGMLIVADFGVPQDPVMSAAFFGVQCLDGFSTTDDNRHGVVRDVIADVGFTPPEPLRRLRTPAGTFEVLVSRRIGPRS